LAFHRRQTRSRNQTTGLAQALQVHRPVEVHDIQAPNSLAAAAAWAIWWFPWGDTLPDPICYWVPDTRHMCRCWPRGVRAVDARCC